MSALDFPGAQQPSATTTVADIDVNAGDFPDRGPAVFAVTTATLILATLFVAGRMVSRVGIVRRTGCDDYVMVLAWLIAVFLSLSINLGAKRGLGRHDRHIEPEHKAGLRMCEYVFSILYNPALMATKTSILIFYLRLSKNTEKVLRLASWAVLGIVNVAGTILTFMNIFQCTPTRAAWDINVEPVRCIPLLTEFICSAPVNITTDLAILALPIPVLTSMRLPPRQKTILVMTFALGIFVTVVDVVRIYYLQQAIQFTPTTPSSDMMAIFGQSAGFSWNASLSLMWSAVEVNVGIICACVPTLKPLIIRILPAMLVDPDGTLRSATRTGSTNTTKQGSSSDERGVSSIGTVLTGPSTNSNTLPPPVVAVTPPDEQEEEISIRDFLSGSPSNPATTGTSRRNHHHLTTSSAAPSFIIPPGSNQPFQNNRASSYTTSSFTTQHPQTAVYFGFVNLSPPKSMLSTSPTASLKYCTVVSILFFLWGFSYGLLNTLNNVVAAVADMSTAQTLGLTSIYFGGGYFLGPLLVGEWLLRHDEHHRGVHVGMPRRLGKKGKERGRRKKGEREDIESVGGFKATFIAGLLIYGIGTIMFWPGAVLTAYGGFMVSSFVVGFGLAVLETAANPFLVLCGPARYADARLLTAQGVQAVGSVLSGLLATRVYFVRLESRTIDSTTLIDVQWTYLSVTLLSVLLALFFYYMPLPEVTDSELAELAARLPIDPKRKSIGGVSLRTWSISLAVFAQWTYVSAQENMSLFFDDLLISFIPDNNPNPISSLAMTPQNYLLLAHSAFAVSRFLAALLCYLQSVHPSSRFLPTPRTLLAICVALSTLFSLLTAAIPPTANSNPNLLTIPVILFFFAEGPIWPLIFSLGLRGQGARTKRAAAWLTMGGCGPGVWPFVLYGILQEGGGGGDKIRVAMVVVVVLMAAVGVFPAWCWGVSGARELVDLGRDSDQDGEGDSNKEGDEGGSKDEESGGGMKMEDGKREGIRKEGNGNGFGDGGDGRREQEVPEWERQALDTTILN